MVKQGCVLLILLMGYCASLVARDATESSVGINSGTNFSVVIKSESSDSNYLKGFLVQYTADDGEPVSGSFAISDVPPSVVSPSVKEYRIPNYELVYFIDHRGEIVIHKMASEKVWRDKHVVGLPDRVIGSSKSPNEKQVALAVRDDHAGEDSILIVDEKSSKVVARKSFDKRSVVDFCWGPDSSKLAVIVGKSRMAVSPLALLLAFSDHPASYESFSAGVFSVSSDKWIESEPLARDVLAGVGYMRCAK